MNMFKKTGGFTLVELIVVIAILAILAGVAIPAYSGYISKAQQAGDLTDLNAVQTAVNAAYATADDLPTAIKVVEPSTVQVAFDAAGAEFKDMDKMNDFLLYYGADLNLELESVTDGNAVTWTKDKGWAGLGK